MHRYEWVTDHAAALLALVAIVILVFAWPLENLRACVMAAAMMVVAAGITIRAHFHSAGHANSAEMTPTRSPIMH
jgi:hypothetical protein